MKWKKMKRWQKIKEWKDEKNENQKINNHTSIDKLRERKKKPQFIIEYLTEVSLTSTTNCGALKKG